MEAPEVEVIASWGTSGDHVVQVYKTRPRRLRRPGRAQHYRWRRLAENNRVVATSGEGYVNYEDCRGVAMLINPPRDPRSWTGRR